VLAGNDRAFPIDGLPDGIEHPADNRIPNGDLGDPSGAAYLVALLDVGVVSQDHAPDIVLLQVQGDPQNAVCKLHHLRGHHIAQPVDPGDPVPNLEDGSDPNLFDLLFISCQLFLQNSSHFFRSNCHIY